jgi:hypothetical protein
MDDIAAELRSDNQTVSCWLIYYRERKKATELLREEIIDASPAPQADRVQSNRISDSTCDRAYRLIQKTANAADWIWCVDACRTTLGPRKRILLDLVQEAATLSIAGNTKRWWVPWVQQQYYHRHGSWLNDKSINIYWEDIVERCARIAGKKRIL